VALGELGLREPQEIRLFDQVALIAREQLQCVRDGPLLLAQTGARFRILGRRR